MIELNSSAPKTLIVSNNMVEADDLTEMLTSQGFGPVLHTRDLDDAKSLLTGSQSSIRLLMFGLSLHVHEAQEFLATVDVSGKSLLVIDGPLEYAEKKGAGVLLRPYSTADVMAALKVLGLKD